MSRSVALKVTLGTGNNKQDISDRITSLTYKRSLTHDDTVDIDIENADAEWLMEQPCCYPGSPITFSYGYIGLGMTEEVTLSLGDIEPVYSGKNGCTLSISSVDASQAMKKLHSNKIWKNMRADEIVQALAELHGLDAEIQMFMSDPKSQAINLDNSLNRSSDSTSNAELITTNEQTNPSRLAKYKNILKHSVNGRQPVPFATYDSYPMGWVSNHEFLQTMTSGMNLGWISYVKNRTIYFVQRNNAAPPLRIVTRGSDDIIRFKIKYREITGKGSEERIDTHVFDPKTVETYIQLGEYHLVGSDGVISRVNQDGSRQVLDRSRIDNSKQSSDDLVYTDDAWVTVNEALKSVNVTNIPPDEVIKYLAGTQSNASVRQALEEKFAIAQEGIQEIKDEMLTATLEEQGRLDMDINIVIGIAGFATMYNGNWFVYEVTDKVSKGGFFTTSELRKGEAKKGVLPTNAANTSNQPEEKGRIISAVQGWDYPAGVNVNNPQVNPAQTTTTKTPTPDKAQITTR